MKAGEKKRKSKEKKDAIKSNEKEVVIKMEPAEIPPIESPLKLIP